MHWFHFKIKKHSSAQTTVPTSPVTSDPQRLEVRHEAVRGSGEKAARRDLESHTPLGDRSHFQNGLHAAHGEAVSNRIEQGVADIAAVDEDIAELEREAEWRSADAKKAADELEKAEKQRDKVPAPRRLGTISTLTYVVLMVLFAAVEYPLLRLSLVRLPVDDATIKVIAVLIGASLVAGTHVFALATARLVLHEGDRIESRRDWFAHRAVVVSGVIFYLFVIVGLAWVRAGEIFDIGNTFGQGMSHPVWLGIALGFLQAATLLAAFYIAYQRARSAEWCEANANVEEAEDRKKAADEALEELDRREARLHVRREAISDRADHDLDRLHRHHKHEEAKYLAILARELETPPKPIDDWDDARTPRTRHKPSGRTVKRQPHTNGKPDPQTVERVRRTVKP